MARDDSARLRRDEANVGPDPRQARSLVPMSELKKLKVGDGEPDIRGWSVFTSTGREVGAVQELLVDTTVMEVVMLDIDLRRDNRHTLAPLRAAWIDRDHRRVIIEASEIADPEELPTLGRRDTLSDSEVDEFDRRYTRAYGGRELEHDYRYRHGGEDVLRFGGDRNRSDEDEMAVQERDQTRDRATVPAAARPVADQDETEQRRVDMAQQAARDAAAAREAAERAARSAEKLAAERDRTEAERSAAQPSQAESSRYVRRRRLEPGESWTITREADGDPDRTVRMPLRDRGDAPPSNQPRDRPDDRRI